MCECLCGELKGDIVLKIGTTTLVVDAYSGCQECAQIVGIDVHAFNEQGAKDWDLEDAREITPDEYGIPPTAGEALELFSVTDLGKAADELGLKESLDEYETAADWFSDFGLQLIHKAFAMCDQRKRERKR